MNTDLSRFDNSWYKPGASLFRQVLWYFISALLFKHSLFPFSAFKVWILRLFGAKTGIGINIKPAVNIKYPWRLKVGDYAWIGENVWIDNLEDVEIGRHCCISQGAMLLCGNHDYKKETFDLIVGKITLEDGVWIGANAIVCPGITCKSHAILTVGSVATKNLEPYGVYQGNPAVRVKDRITPLP